MFVAKRLPSLGYRIYNIVRVEEEPHFETGLRSGNNWIENGEYSIEFDEFSGAITRFFDKTNQHEMIRSNANTIVMENEIGDIYRHEESYFSDEMHSITSTRCRGTVSIVESGPVRIVVEITGDIEKTKRVQRVILYDRLSRIDFETSLDFKEHNKQVKLEFPLMIFSNKVNIGSQFGFESKVSNKSDLLDWEDNPRTLAGLDWIDCVGPEYGLLFSTFGLHEYEYRDGVLSFTLLRSVSQLSHGRDDEIVTTKSAREWGPYKFKYAMVPHSRDTISDEVWRFSTEYLTPLIGYPLDNIGTTQSNDGTFMSMSGLSLEVAAVIPHEIEGEFVIRLYEAAGKQGNGKLIFSKNISKATLIDLADQEVGELVVRGNSVELQVDPYSILSVLVRFV
jgi:alpha-mannosidase